MPTRTYVLPINAINQIYLTYLFQIHHMIYVTILLLYLYDYLCDNYKPS